MSIIFRSFKALLSLLGITRTQDLPPIPDASPEQLMTPPKQRIDNKHVTFSPQKEFIPQYEFGAADSSALSGKQTPIRLIHELQEICPEECSTQFVQLAKIVEDLRDELEDLKLENARLERENKKLRVDSEFK